MRLGCECEQRYSGSGKEGRPTDGGVPTWHRMPATPIKKADVGPVAVVLDRLLGQHGVNTARSCVRGVGAVASSPVRQTSQLHLRETSFERAVDQLAVVCRPDLATEWRRLMMRSHHVSMAGRGSYWTTDRGTEAQQDQIRFERAHALECEDVHTWEHKPSIPITQIPINSKCTPKKFCWDRAHLEAWERVVYHWASGPHPGVDVSRKCA